MMVNAQESADGSSRTISTLSLTRDYELRRYTLARETSCRYHVTVQLASRSQVSLPCLGRFLAAFWFPGRIKR